MSVSRPSSFALLLILLLALSFFVGCGDDQSAPSNANQETGGDGEFIGDRDPDNDGETGDGTSSDNETGDETSGDNESGDDDDLDLYVGSSDVYEPGPLTVSRITNEADAPAPFVAFIPDGDYTFPLVVFQHGFLMANTHYTDLLTHIASHGFVVVAPQMYEAGGLPIGKPSTSEEATLASQFYDWLFANGSTTLNVDIAFDRFGLAGHSRGAKALYRAIKNNPRPVQAIAGVDPVDGTGGPLGGDTRVLDAPPTFNAPVLILGTGLGPDSANMFSPACAPEGDNHEQFYAAASSPAFSVIADDYGHMDMLDDAPAGCGLECDACVDGPSRAPMRQLTGGMLVSLFRAALQGVNESFDLLSDDDSAPINITVDSK